MNRNRLLIFVLSLTSTAGALLFLTAPTCKAEIANRIFNRGSGRRELIRAPKQQENPFTINRGN